MNQKPKTMTMPPCWRGHFEFDVPDNKKALADKPEVVEQTPPASEDKTVESQ